MPTTSESAITIQAGTVPATSSTTISNGQSICDDWK